MKCFLPQCKKCGGVYKLFGVVVIVIFAYWFLLNISYGMDNAIYKDPLNKVVFNISGVENCCSWWPISHYLFFTIIGLLYPDCDAVAIGGGIIWELFEVCAHSFMKKERQGVRYNDSERIEYSDNWWAGSFKDIGFNIVGFYTGKILRRSILDKHVDKCCDTNK
jgi:hypothetical protein